MITLYETIVSVLLTDCPPLLSLMKPVAMLVWEVERGRPGARI